MMLWSFSNKSSGPQLLSFNGSHDERAVIHFDSLPSSRFAIDESDSNNYPASQIASILERRDGFPCSVTTPFLVTGQNPFTYSTPRPHSGVPAKNPFVGTSDFRSDSKISAASPGQLTIFYNGSVSVFDNISPEKAQAIMLLAGNKPAPVTALQPITAAVAFAQPYGFTMSQPRCSYPESNHDSSSTKRCEVPDEYLMHSKGTFVPVPTRQISGAVSQCRSRPLVGFVEKRQKR